MKSICAGNTSSNRSAAIAKKSLKPVALPTHVKRGMIEEFTGEMVYWDEELPLDDYQRDTMPWDVGAGSSRAGRCLPGAVELERVLVCALDSVIDGTAYERHPSHTATRFLLRPRRHARHGGVQCAAASRRSRTARRLDRRAARAQSRSSIRPRRSPASTCSWKAGRATSTRSIPSRSWPSCTCRSFAATTSSTRR